MLTPAVTVVVSLILVAVIGYVGGMLQGRWETATLKDALERCRSEVGELERQLEKASGRLDTRDKELERVASLESELVETRARLAALRAATQSRGATAADQTPEQAAAEVPTVPAQAVEAEELRQHAEELEAAHAEQRRRADAEIDALRRELEEARQKSSRADERYEQMAREREDTTGRLETLVQGIAGHDKRVARLRSELEDLENNYAEQVRERDDEAERLQARLQARELELKGLQTQQEEKHQELRTQLQEAQRAAANLRLERDDLTERLEALEADLREGTVALERSRLEAQELEQSYLTQVQERDEQIDSLQGRFERATVAVADSEDRLRAQAQRFEERRVASDALEAELVRSGEQLSELTRRLADADDRTDALSLEIEEQQAAGSRRVRERDLRIEQLQRRADPCKCGSTSWLRRWNKSAKTPVVSAPPSRNRRLCCGLPRHKLADRSRFSRRSF